jgi:B12-binding domain/radical SAM domain protein of rhizo-twelve system
MKVALVNPPWTFGGSIYFGCREPHLPLEFGYAKALLERAGHEAAIFDAHLFQFSIDELCRQIAEYRPDLTAITTAPSYLFWRCPPPELRVPQLVVSALRDVAGTLVAVGPHGSTTPRTTMEKLGVDAVVLGECEETLVELAGRPVCNWSSIEGIARWEDGKVVGHGAPRTVHLDELPALRWSEPWLTAHRHHHHRFDSEPRGPGAEIEASRGCPYRCTFCAKQDHRDAYRKRHLATTLDELDGLVAGGVRYVYFIDEIFLPDRPLLEALAARDLVFGVQMRIDNWTKETLDLLGRAGCVSVEAGVESLTERGRSLLAKRCRASTHELTELLIHAKRSIAFVQANLLESGEDDRNEVESWRAHLRAHGVWANEPVPLFPYPGSPDYKLRWGDPDDRAWERAHHHYLGRFDHFSDVQDDRPLPLAQLEQSRP